MPVPGLTGRSGGRLVYAQRTEPKTFNPLIGDDIYSREVINRLMADLIHINRSTLKTEAGLAKSWKISPDGLRYILELRQGVRFSDGHPFDADDVVFTFQTIFDERVNTPERNLLTLDGKPIAVRKLGQYRVAFDLPVADAVAERLFDSVHILPRHLLEKAYREGKLREAWGLRTPPAEIAGLGPFRLKQYVPGQRIVLERNPYYWKTDAAGRRLPYLTELEFAIAGSEDMQILRFQAGESDIANRMGARDFAQLEKDSARKGYILQNAGPGFDYTFLFFNLAPSAIVSIAARQAFWSRVNFRRAVALAIDRDAIVRVVYRGYATPLGEPVAPGHRYWVNQKLPHLTRSVPRAKELLTADGFKWAKDGALLDPAGRKVQFSIVTSATNPERGQTATMIQADLKELGMDVQVVPLEFRSLTERLFKTHDYEACLMPATSVDADPSADMTFWLSSGGLHFWNPEQKTPATPWEAEIDTLMRRQAVSMKPVERKQSFDKVQALAMEHLPFIPLVTQNILVGARKTLGNFHPAILDHYTLWNVEELYWQAGAAQGSR